VSARESSRGRPGRRRNAALLVFAAGAVAAAIIALPVLTRFVRELTYPLHDVSIINRQAAVEHLDPALVAAVIYAESKFDPRPSSAGALGLMQIEPATAELLAQKSGGTLFKIADLAHPATNIAYGSYYLRYLLRMYGGSRMLALAAYNAGPGNVDRWIARARKRGRRLDIDAIPFAQTRAYVVKVEAATKTYRRYYGKLLGRP
jgi:soluble lytic murein transglycosylase